MEGSFSQKIDGNYRVGYVTIHTFWTQFLQATRLVWVYLKDINRYAIILALPGNTTHVKGGL